ncbi:hypothetical protein [Roseinatronobacter sp. S2]|uniref:hypothetical protein n=1 Tax=Roseinatronobacter sp. S2 TaxID=3035471 RepID=UPI0024103CD4|nr:hypothetical protein [Roseinatronobacter sp. S2]WFE75370.1 hypothetical protein P8S53_02910 [Roseinatronobacter sp. S2]
MKPLALGDMARSHLLRQNSNSVKRQMTSLQHELISGQVNDKLRRTGGEAALLASLQRSMSMSKTNQTNAVTISTFLNAQQEALNRVSDITKDKAAYLIRPELFSTDDRLSGAVDRADAALRDITTLLNSSLGGKSIFAGRNSDSPALRDVDGMISSIVSIIPADADYQTIDQVVSDWFAPGGAFELEGYMGGPEKAEAISLGDGYNLRLDLTASDTAIRSILAELTKGAVLKQGLLSDQPDQQRLLLRNIGANLFSAASALQLTQEHLGIKQAYTEEARTEADASYTSSQIALNELLAVDEYDVASRLQDAMARLDKIYLMTARLSRLSLSEYL